MKMTQNIFKLDHVIDGISDGVKVDEVMVTR